MKGWEIALHKGRVKEALDLVLADQNKMTIFTMLTALRHRSALRTSLEGRDEITLQPIMKWVHLHLPRPIFVPICVEVAMNVMDLYSKHLGQSIELANQVRKLHKRVKQEVEKSQEAGMTRGMLEMLDYDAGG